MSAHAADLTLLYTRDLKRLGEELAAFLDEPSLWAILPGISNSAGHLTLHLEGNLREFIGRLLGGIEYTRNRPQEFASAPISKAELLTRINTLTAQIPTVLSGLSGAQLEADYPQAILGRPFSTGGMLIHLSGHLQWHLGQIDYLRRALTGSGAIVLSPL